MNKRISIILSVILCFSILVTLSMKAEAADFSYSGLDDIYYMWQHTNGNIRAMDKTGAVAEFDYIKWTRICNSPTGQNLCTVLDYHNADYARNEIKMSRYVYNISTNAWSEYSTIFRTSFRYNGEFYGLRLQGIATGGYTVYLTKYTYSWVDVLDLNVNLDGNTMLIYSFGDFNFKNKQLTILLSNDTGSVFVDMTNSTLMAQGVPDRYNINSSYNYTSYASATIRVYTYSNNNIPILAFTTDSSTKYNFPQIKGLGDNGRIITVASPVDETDTKIYGSGGALINSIDSHKEIKAGCVDFFGFTILGGLGGYVCVCQNDGTTTTDTNFYTDFAIGAVKEAAIQAKEAAEAGLDASQAAQTAAENAEKLATAPVIRHFKVNDGTLERSGTADTTGYLLAQNSPTDTGYNNLEYKIMSISSIGIETELVGWTNYTPVWDPIIMSTGKSLIVVGGINTYKVYVRNKVSGVESSATTVLLAGTDEQLATARAAYYGTWTTQINTITNTQLKKDGVNIVDSVISGGKTAISELTNATYGLSSLNYTLTSQDAAKGLAKIYDMIADGDWGLNQTHSEANLANQQAELAKTNASEATTAATEAGTKADAAKTSADAATTQATTAASKSTTAVSEIQNVTYGLSATKTKVDSTYTKANTAATQATTAASKSTTAVSELQSGTYGLSATKTKVDNTYTKADTAATKAATAVNNTQTDDSGTTKSAAALAKEARDKVIELEQNIAPVINNVKGYNGATCTTTGTFKLVVTASGATQYRAWIESGPSAGWQASNILTLIGISAGAKTINVQVKNSAGVTADGAMMMFKI